MEWSSIMTYVGTAALAGAAWFFGDKYVQFKKCINLFTEMWADDKITQEEWNECITEAKKLIRKQ